MYNNDVVLINTACESGGTGRRARLRGVWETVRVRFPSLAPKQKERVYPSLFVFVWNYIIEAFKRLPIGKRSICVCKFWASRNARANGGSWFPSLAPNTKDRVNRLGLLCFIWGEESNPSLECLHSRIGCANSAKGSSALALEPLEQNSSLIATNNVLTSR